MPLLPVTDCNDCEGYCLLGCETMKFGRQVLGTYLPNSMVKHTRRVIYSNQCENLKSHMQKKAADYARNLSVLAILLADF
jgi:hypothetical protein